MSNIYLEHALLDVRDLETSLAFYRKLFRDWTVRWQGHTGEGAPWVHFGPAGEGRPGYLSLPEKPQARSADADSLARLRIQHIGFAHPDVEELVSRLDAAGIQPHDRADDGRYRRVYFVDPDGHELEFVQQTAS